MDRIEGMVSVVIPYYNRRGLIVDCLKSVLAQTYSNLEVIIVDDGSKESALDLLEPFLSDRVRYHRYTPNQGACHARNVGVSLARGEYIAFQDSDDLWLPRKLEKQMAAMAEKKADFLFCGLERRNLNSNTSEYVPALGFDESGDSIAQLLWENRVSTQTILVRREVFEAICFDETLRRLQDWDFTLQAAKAGLRIAYLPEALVQADIQADSITVQVGGAEPFEALYRKYAAEFRAVPAAEAKMLTQIARRCAMTEPKKAKNLLRESLKRKFQVKTLLKYMFYMFFGLWAKK